MTKFTTPFYILMACACEFSCSVLQTASVQHLFLVVIIDSRWSQIKVDAQMIFDNSISFSSTYNQLDNSSHSPTEKKIEKPFEKETVVVLYLIKCYFCPQLKGKHQNSAIHIRSPACCRRLLIMSRGRGLQIKRENNADKTRIHTAWTLERD